MKIVLASTSPHRKKLLGRLQLAFISDNPDVLESTIENETIEDMVVRLALEKANAVRHKHSDSIIIGSDQSAVLDGKMLSKPESHDNAVIQLKAASDKTITFQTGICTLNTVNGNIQSFCVPYTVHFRKLSETMIQNYLHKEKPYDCVGSFKSEGLGISLFSKLEGPDPTSLVGLPLIKLTEMLINEGVNII